MAIETRDHPDWWRPVGGANSPESVLERRSLVSNNGAVLTGWRIGTATYRGKFFTRGMHGFIDYIEVYCDNTSGANQDIDIEIAPYPGAPSEISVTLTVPFGSAPAWRPVNVREMWNYDGMFIWLIADDVGFPRFAYDIGPPFDHYHSANEVDWVVDVFRNWIRVTMTGETPGDVPVSGFVNVKNIDKTLSTAGLKDFHDQVNTALVALTINLNTDYAEPRRGWDFLVHNLGGADITVAIDGVPIKTVRENDAFGFRDTEWYIMVLANPGTVNVEITVTGDIP